MARHVVIIGGGFAGLTAAKRLANAPVTITLIDRRNHHLFQPLLYQVATGALNPGDIAVPIRAALANQRNVRVLMANATGIDPVAQRVVLDDGSLSYDDLIVATGATHSYFGQPWQAVAPGLKTVEDALEIRRRVFLAYEAAEREADASAQTAWLTFVVVGAGPTGVELAGALGEIGLHTLARDFRRIDPTRVRVVLIEGKDRVLPVYPPRLSAAAAKELAKRQVEVRCASIVTAIDEAGVTVRVGLPSDGTHREERIAARTILWAAGVAASPLVAQLGPTDRAGRVLVEPDLSVPAHRNVFVVGDAACVRTDAGEVPGVAQGAIQGAVHVANILSNKARGKTGTRAPFRYRDKGSMATIGRGSAVVATKRVARSGFFAWLFWWVIHIAYLVGFRNRLVVMFQWAWSFVTFARGSRLITGDTPALPPVHDVGSDGQLALPKAAALIDVNANPRRDA